MNKKTAQILEIAIVYAVVIGVTLGFHWLVFAVTSVPLRMAFMLIPLGIFIALPILLYRAQQRPLSELGIVSQRWGRQALIAVVLAALLLVGFVAIPLLLGLNKTDVLSFKASSPAVFAFYVIKQLFFLGFGEEILFRGYFLEKLKQVTGSGVWGVILSSLLFGLFHYPIGQNILQVLVTTLLGMIFGFSRLKIKDCSVLSLGLAHGLYDAGIVVLSQILL